MFRLQNELTDPYQGSSVGILVVNNVVNMPSHQELDEKKRLLEDTLREKYGGLTRSALKTIHPMDVYVAYYKKFGYSYHVLPQLESILKGKSIPSISALVTSMFMAELKNMMLTAGHDLDRLVFPIRLHATSGLEAYVGIGGKYLTTVAGDIAITDQKGMISSILRGPDRRTRIGPKTTSALFSVYAPPQIDGSLIYNHLDDIELYLGTFSTQASTTVKQVFTTR